MAKVDIVLGLQWGDEGKGKVVDVLAPGYPVVSRFQGGPNAGHSLHFDGELFVLHTIPSGIFREGALNIIGNGVVVDPVILLEEISRIEAKCGRSIAGRLVISNRTQLILPTHRMLDAASEAAKGKAKIGSTLKGIGPAYTDKIGRCGLRFGDIAAPDFRAKYEALKERHMAMLALYPGFSCDVADYEARWFEAVEALRRFRITDTERLVDTCLKAEKPILAEGAQGSLLDIDFGSYPFVTSSNTLAGGVCSGLGVAPTRIGKVFGIFKAYCTRVGSGPFPTELFDGTGEALRQAGHEFGATTGRPRRCGWLDMVALKYAVMMNGVTELLMMKSDVLDDFDTVKVAVAYEKDGEVMADYPYDGGVGVTPVYKEFRGWKTDITGIRSFDALPAALKDYVAFIEKQTGCPVKIISVGPDRDANIIR